jgi:hypothetical protein
MIVKYHILREVLGVTVQTRPPVRRYFSKNTLNQCVIDLFDDLKKKTSDEYIQDVRSWQIIVLERLAHKMNLSVASEISAWRKDNH